MYPNIIEMRDKKSLKIAKGQSETKNNRHHNGQKKNNRHHNGQKKKDKRTKNDIQNIHMSIKTLYLKWEYNYVVTQLFTKFYNILNIALQQ